MPTDAVATLVRRCLLDVIGCEYMEGRCQCGITSEDVKPEQSAVIISYDLFWTACEVINGLYPGETRSWGIGRCWRLTEQQWYAVQHESYAGEQLPWMTDGPMGENTHAC